MSRLPSTTPLSSGLQKLSRFSQQPSRKKRNENSPLQQTKFTRSTSQSQTSDSSYDEVDSPISLTRYSISSSSTTQTASTTPRTSLTTPSPSATKLISRPSLLAKTNETSKLSVGDRVAVESMGIVGTLKYMGPTQFKAGTWAGIQLDTIGTGKNNGSVNGVRYFTCPPRTGIFVMLCKLTPVDQNTPSNSPTKKRRSTPSSTLRSRASPYIGLSQPSKGPVKPEASQSAIMSSPTWMARRRSPTPSLPPSPEASRSHLCLKPTTTGIPSPATTPSTSTAQDNCLVNETKKDCFPSVTPQSPKMVKLRDGASSIDLYTNWSTQTDWSNTNQISGDSEAPNGTYQFNSRDAISKVQKQENNSLNEDSLSPTKSDNVWEQTACPSPQNRVNISNEETMSEVVQSLTESATRADANLTISVPTKRASIFQHQLEEHNISLQAEIERHISEKEQLIKKVHLLENEKNAGQTEMDILKRELADRTQTMEGFQSHILHLEQSVEDLKRAGMESLELYDSAVRLHQDDMKKLNTKLTEQQSHLDNIQSEREDLRKAGLEAIEAYEKTIDDLKKQYRSMVDAKERQQQEMKAVIEQLQQEITQLKESSLSGTARLQLEDDLKAAKEALTEEREKIVNLEKKNGELEQKIKDIHAEHQAQVTAYTQDLEEKRRKETEVHELRKSKEIVERDLVTIKEKLADAESTLIEVRAHDHLVEDTLGLLEQERQQHAYDMEMLRVEIEKLEAQNSTLIKEKERSLILSSKYEMGFRRQIDALKKENAQLTADHEKLRLSHAEIEKECIRLMDEVERLRTTEPVVLLSRATDDEDEEINTKAQIEQRVVRLEGQLCESESHLERILIQHAAEIRQLTDKHAKESQERWRQIKKLNDDVAVLERLIEDKSFKEADMEEALKQERRRTQRLQYQLGGNRGSMINRNLTVSKRWTALSKPVFKDEEEDAYCEICEKSGHDLMSCSTVLERCSTKLNSVNTRHVSIGDEIDTL
ncbi:hypothetical protein EC973_008737 [Apophysomyces ossiformis]|uniref:CAP-Gly domain-containing protein n=1 Tax=Apophysomyces ossiformis TaxID=679940 RepID=A0A8H7ETD3_9FUNG|nr:hypothetical protein EC973_008737 [Apophysomyces ossiformis]